MSSKISLFSGHGQILFLSFLSFLTSCNVARDSAVSGAPSSGSDLQKTLVVENLADPDVLKVNEDLYFLTGTGERPGSELPIYESNNLEDFRFKRNYVPSNVDTAFNYCDLWAPDLSLNRGVYNFYFSARRVPKGHACPGTAPSEPTTYLATASGPDLNFGAPQLVQPSPTGARAILDKGCPTDGCNKAVRIDAEVFQEGEATWFFYVWFDRGNNISSFRMNDSGKGLVDNLGPARFPTPPSDEGINEGPTVFKRGSKYYLFFSTGNFDSQYAMHYIMADSVEQLTRAQPVHRYSQAVRKGNGQLVESHGHNSIVERRGIYYNFFHQGFFRPDGKYTGKRNTYKKRMHFHSNGHLSSLNLVDLKWVSQPKAEYSLDIVTRSGEVIGHCFTPAQLARNSGVTFNGICPGAGDRVIAKDDIASFRLFWSFDGRWGGNVKELPYNGVADSLILAH